MIYLEPFTAADFSQLIAWVDNERLLKEWTGAQFSFPLTNAQLQAYIQHANCRRQSDTYAFKALNSRTGEAIGHISLSHIDWEQRTARITRVLVGRVADRCQGYCRAMMKALLRFGFDELGLQRISLGVYDFNAPAIRCYQRCGFQHIGTLRHVVRYGNEYWSSVEMCLEQQQWQQLRQPAALAA